MQPLNRAATARLLPRLTLLCVLVAAGAWGLFSLYPGPVLDLATGVLTLVAFLLVVALGLRRLMAPAALAAAAQAPAPLDASPSADPTQGYPLDRPTRHGGDPRIVAVLEATLRTYRLRYGAFFDRERVLADAGEPDGRHVYLVSGHVGPAGSPAATLRWLGGAILPQWATQGPDFAVADLVTPELGLLLVGSRGEAAMEAPGRLPEETREQLAARLGAEWQWMKRVAEECKAEYSRAAQ